MLLAKFKLKLLKFSCLVCADFRESTKVKIKFNCTAVKAIVKIKPCMQNQCHSETLLLPETRNSYLHTFYFTFKIRYFIINLFFIVIPFESMLYRCFVSLTLLQILTFMFCGFFGLYLKVHCYASFEKVDD